MEVSHFFDKLYSQYNNKLPFVVFRKPKSNIVEALLQNDNKLYKVSDYTESGFVFAPFNNRETATLIPVDQCNQISCSNTFERKIENSKYIDNQQDDSKSDSYIKLVESAIHAIKQNEFSKVVISRCEEVSLDYHPIDVFKSLLNYNNAFVYCWYHPKVGLWLGATPETLFQLKGKRLTTMSLAGTQNYDEVDWTEKEINEQQIVTDFITKNLSNITNNLRISETQTVKVGHLAHLKTDIVAVTKDSVSIKQIIDAMHPTPAVCGLSRETSKAFILKHEGYNREFYTGYLGFVNIDTKLAPRSRKSNIEDKAYQFTQKQTELYVNLRCMQLKNEKALIYVGGGITEASNPKNEWQETINKSMVMKQILKA